MWFPSAQIRGGKGGGGGESRWIVGSSVSLVSGIKAEVFLLLFNRRLLSSLHGSRMFQEKYGSNALELRCVF